MISDEIKFSNVGYTYQNILEAGSPGEIHEERWKELGLENVVDFGTKRVIGIQMRVSSGCWLIIDKVQQVAEGVLGITCGRVSLSHAGLAVSSPQTQMIEIDRNIAFSEFRILPLKATRLRDLDAELDNLEKEHDQLLAEECTFMSKFSQEQTQTWYAICFRKMKLEDVTELELKELIQKRRDNNAKIANVRERINNRKDELSNLYRGRITP